MFEVMDFTLPGGMLDRSGRCHRHGQLRPLTGGDEDWLYSLAPATRRAGVVTALLARCVICIGPHAMTAELGRALSVGDRDHLLLELFGATFGDTLWRVLVCPHAGCGARMDLDLALADIPVVARPSAASHRVRLDDAGTPVDVEFRAPSGRDQEQIAAIDGAAPDALRDQLLAACVVRAVADGGAERPFDALSLPARQALADAIEEVVPQLELELELVCPECARSFELALDPAAILLDEVQAGRAAFERELHLLAFHYHWSLDELMRLTRPGRRRFLRLLTEQLGARAQV